VKRLQQEYLGAAALLALTFSAIVGAFDMRTFLDLLGSMSVVVTILGDSGCLAALPLSALDSSSLLSSGHRHWKQQGNTASRD